MSALASVYFKKDTLEKMLMAVNSGDGKGLEITIDISDSSSEYGSNLTTYKSMTKEERTAKKEKEFISYGKVFWNSGSITNGVKSEASNEASVPAGDIPF